MLSAQLQTLYTYALATTENAYLLKVAARKRDALVPDVKQAVGNDEAAEAEVQHCADRLAQLRGALADDECPPVSLRQAEKALSLAQGHAGNARGAARRMRGKLAEAGDAVRVRCRAFCTSLLAEGKYSNEVLPYLLAVRAAVALLLPTPCDAGSEVPPSLPLVRAAVAGEYEEAHEEDAEALGNVSAKGSSLGF